MCVPCQIKRTVVSIKDLPTRSEAAPLKRVSGRSEIDREYLKDPRRANSNDENGEEGRGILLSRNRRYDEGGECGSRNNLLTPSRRIFKPVGHESIHPNYKQKHRTPEGPEKRRSEQKPNDTTPSLSGRRHPEIKPKATAKKTADKKQGRETALMKSWKKKQKAI